MKNSENKIIFKEIRTYEEAYYYNSDPTTRKKHDSNNENVVKKESKINNSFMEFIGVIFESALEILFSILD